jgi:hypothetical protein
VVAFAWVLAVGFFFALRIRYAAAMPDKRVIVRCVHRPKRLPRRRKAVAIVGPAIVTKAIRRAPADTPPVDDEQEPAAPPPGQ